MTKMTKNDKNVAKFTFWSHHGFCYPNSEFPFGYKGRSILVLKLPLEGVKVKSLEFSVEKSRQIEGSSVRCSLNVNKVSRIFSRFFVKLEF